MGRARSFSFVRHAIRASDFGHSGRYDVSSQFFVVFGECLQYVPDAGEHQGIDLLLVFPGDLAKLIWQSKSNQIIRRRQTLTQLILNPLPVFVVLAMRTVSVAA